MLKRYKRNNTSILVINGDKKFPEIKEINTNKYKYIIGEGEIFNDEYKSLNNNLNFRKIARDLRDEYNNWIYSHNSLFIDQNLIFNKDLSLFFFTDFADKRIKLFSTYEDICNLLTLKEIINKYKFDRIYLNGLSDFFIKSFKSLFYKEGLNLVITRNFRKKKIGKNFIFQILKSMKLVFKYFYAYLINNISKSKQDLKFSITNGDLYLSRFPLNFNKKFVEDKYENIPSNSDKYAVSIFSDDLIQTVPFFKYFGIRRLLESRKNKFILIDNYVRGSDLIYAMVNIFTNSIKYKKLLKRKFIFRNIDLTNQIRDELLFSLGRVNNLITSSKIFDRFLSNNKFNSFIFYLHEFAYGRMISYCLTKKGISRSIGMQHGLPSWSWLIYFLSKGEINKSLVNKNNYIKQRNLFLYDPPIPNKLFVEDEFAKSIYKYSGYKNIFIMKYVPRKERIKSIKFISKKEFILIAPGLRDEKILLNTVYNEIKENNKQKYLCKCHPHSKEDKAKFLRLENLSFVDENIYCLLKRCSKLYVTYSSVGYDAFLLGIPVKIIDIPGIINTSNLIDIIDH